MKKLMMLLIAATLSATALQAQNADNGRSKKTPEEKAQMRTEHLSKKLELTPEQAQKVNQIFLVSAQKRAELKSRSGNEKKAMGQEMKAIKENTNQQLKAVLTPEQWSKKEQLEAERKEKHKGHKMHKDKGAKENGHRKGKSEKANSKS